MNVKDLLKSNTVNNVSIVLDIYDIKYNIINVLLIIINNNTKNLIKYYKLLKEHDIVYNRWSGSIYDSTANYIFIVNNTLKFCINMNIEELLFSEDMENKVIALDILGVRRQKYPEVRFISFYNGEYKLFYYFYKKDLVKISISLPPNCIGGFIEGDILYLTEKSYNKCLRLYNKRKSKGEEIPL